MDEQAYTAPDANGVEQQVHHLEQVKQEPADGQAAPESTEVKPEDQAYIKEEDQHQQAAGPAYDPAADGVAQQQGAADGVAQQQDAGGQNEAGAQLQGEQVKTEEAEGAQPPQATGVSSDGGAAAGEQPTRKRRSKWEDPPPSTSDDQPAMPDLPPPPPQRKHRWGPPMTELGDGRRKKRSRWEEKTSDTPSNAIVVAAPAGLSIGSFTFPKQVKLSSGLVVSLPQHLSGDSADPKIRALHHQLRECERKIEKGELDIPPEGQRSPSPEPVYDRNGIRLNTREIRYKERLLDLRLRIIEDLIKEDPTYKPPADYRPRKFSAKVRIPQEEYPNYNFIGLLIGPRGNTQKRMQQETNTKIAIRGRGSVKEGSNKDPKYDYGEDEELHVLVTGNTQQDVDRAVAMIELLCRPDDDSLNEHKRLQLRELAALNGTLKDEVACPICGEFTHRGYECPNQKQELYVLPDAIKAKVEEQYMRDVARVRGAEAVASEEDYKTFMRELGGAPPPELMGDLSGSTARRGLGMPGKYGPDVSDECKLYVGSLPSTFTNTQLKAMFEPFGNVNHAVVVMDQVTGQSRSFGFVHFDDAATAKTAAEAMNGKQLEGRSLVVRLRSEPPDAKRGPGGGGGGGGPPFHDNINTLYVTALNPSVTEGMLRTIFDAYGRVVECRLIVDRVTGVSKGYAFVTMSNPDEVQAAIQGANGYKVEGRAMVVKKAGLKSDGPPGGGPGGGPPPPHPMAPPPGSFHGPPGGPHPAHHHHWPPPHPHSGPPPGYHPHHGPPAGPFYPPPAAPGAPPPPYGYHPGAPPPAYYGGPPPPYGHLPPPAPYYPPPSGPGAYYPPPAYAAQPPLPAAAPAAAAAYPGYGASAAQAAYPPAPSGAEAPPLPPLPTEPAPPPPPQPQQAQSEYERFMSELQKTFQ